MPAFLIIRWLIVLAFALASKLYPQTLATETPYNLRVSVNEIGLTFNATSSQGVSIDDLKLDELHLLDQGKPPRQIVAFQLLQNAAIHAGILIDTSPSMEQTRPEDRVIAIQYAKTILRRQADNAFVMNFGILSQVVQPWTNDPTALTSAIRNRKIVGNLATYIHGTAIFDAIYQACSNQFGHIDSRSGANLMLLFTDGEDNASLTSLRQAIDVCQHTNTAIYVFRDNSKSSFGSLGLKTLLQLTSETGGRIFNDSGSEADVTTDLHTMEGDLRHQYRLVYKPAELKHNGSFHPIELQGPDRVASIQMRSGYFAPSH